MAVAFAEDTKGKKDDKSLESKKQDKRGLYDFGYGFQDNLADAGLDYHHGHSAHEAVDTTYGIPSQHYGPPEHGYHYEAPKVHIQEKVIIKKVPVPYPVEKEVRVPYPVEKHVQVPYPVKVRNWAQKKNVSFFFLNINTKHDLNRTTNVVSRKCSIG